MVKKTTEQKFEEVEEVPSLKEKVVEIDRVARVVKGGRRFRFRALVVVGDEASHVGIGTGKAIEVTDAVSKASAKARKNMIEVPLRNTTIPHQIEATYGSARILLKPASFGTGIIAGGPIRAVVELAGISDLLTKSLGSANKINNVKATFLALGKLKKLKYMGEGK